MNLQVAAVQTPSQMTIRERGMRKLPLLLVSAAATLAISLPAPAGSSAARPQAGGHADGLEARLLEHVGVPGVIDVTYGKSYGDADYRYRDIYVLTKGPPPRVLVFVEESGHSATPGIVLSKQFDLPPGTDPQTIDYEIVEEDGHRFERLTVTDVAFRKFLTMSTDGGLVSEKDFPPAFEYPTGVAVGFIQNQVAADFGPPGSPGSIWYGQDYANRVIFGDAIHPNGAELNTDIGKPQNGQILSQFLVNDAENGDLIKVTDATSPSVIGTLEGPVGAGGVNPTRDVAEVPQNLVSDPDKAGVHHILVTVPALHQIYYTLGTGGPWTPLFPAPDPAWRPVRLATTCDSMSVVDVANEMVDFYALEGFPGGAVCTEIAVPFLSGRLTKGGKLPVGVNAYTDLGPPDDAVIRVEIEVRLRGGPNASFSGGKGARAVRSRAKKLDLAAGTVAKFRLSFSRHATAALAEALEDRRRLKGTLELEVTIPTGEKATVTRPITLRRR